MNSREFVQQFNEYPILQELERELAAGKYMSKIFAPKHFKNK